MSTLIISINLMRIRMKATKNQTTLTLVVKTNTSKTMEILNQETRLRRTRLPSLRTKPRLSQGHQRITRLRHSVPLRAKISRTNHQVYRSTRATRQTFTLRTYHRHHIRLSMLPYQTRHRLTQVRSPQLIQDSIRLLNRHPLILNQVRMYMNVVIRRTRRAIRTRIGQHKLRRFQDP